MALKMIALSLSVLFALPSYSDEPADAGRSPSIEPNEIISHVRYLASDELEGRASGTEGGKKAAAYIARVFRESGLAPVGDQGGYLQYFPLPPRVMLGESSSFTIGLGGDSCTLSPGDDYYPLNFADGGPVSGQIVFAGYGISAPEVGYDDYRGVNAEGKVVLALRFAPEGFGRGARFYEYSSLRNKIETAREKGASAILFASPPSRAEEKDLSTLMPVRQAPSPAMPAFIIRRKAAREVLSYSGRDFNEIEKALSRGIQSSFEVGGSYATIRADAVRESCGTANVIGFIQGRAPLLRDEVIIIGAHYDHLGRGGYPGCGAEGNKGAVFNGADDNASGIAGLLELAEFFSSPENLTGRSLLFIAFSGEELGLLGSSHYARNPKIPGKRIVAMINLDMIGRLRGNELTVFGSQSSPVWRGLIDNANSRAGLNISYPESPAPGDQSVFLTLGIPAVQFFTGFHADYHSPSDDWQKINPEGEAAVLGIVSRLIGSLGNAETGIPFPHPREQAVSRTDTNPNPWILLGY